MQLSTTQLSGLNYSLSLLQQFVEKSRCFCSNFSASQDRLAILTPLVCLSPLTFLGSWMITLAWTQFFNGWNETSISWEQCLLHLLGAGFKGWSLLWQYFISDIHVKIPITGVCIISFVKKLVYLWCQKKEFTWLPFKTLVSAKDPWFKPRLAGLVASLGSSCLLYKHSHFCSFIILTQDI